MRINFMVFVFVIGWVRIGSHFHHSADDKIVGGSPAADTRLAPHVTSLELLNATTDNWAKICGGSILTPLYVITACHCVAQVNKASGEVIPLVRYFPLARWKFVAGTACLQNFDETHQVRSPQFIHHHPRCQLESGGLPFLANDVAVAKMDRPFSFNDHVKPVRVSSLRREQFEIHLDTLMKSRPPPYCMVAGWGSTKSISILDYFGITTSTTASTTNSTEIVVPQEDEDRLKIVRLNAMYEGECLFKLMHAFAAVVGGIDLASVQYFGLKLHHQICAHSEHQNESVCKGDSGSGLICNGFFVGVVSWGIGCANPAPDVFQGIPVVLNWLKGEVCSIQTCDDLKKIPDLCNSTSLDNQILNLYREKCFGPGKTTMKHTTGAERRSSEDSSVTNSNPVRPHQV